MELVFQRGRAVLRCCGQSVKVTPVGVVQCGKCKTEFDFDEHARERKVPFVECGYCERRLVKATEVVLSLEDEDQDGELVPLCSKECLDAYIERRRWGRLAREEDAA